MTKLTNYWPNYIHVVLKDTNFTCLEPKLPTIVEEGSELEYFIWEEGRSLQMKYVFLYINNIFVSFHWKYFVIFAMLNEARISDFWIFVHNSISSDSKVGGASFFLWGAPLYPLQLRPWAELWATRGPRPTGELVQGGNSQFETQVTQG